MSQIKNGTASVVNASATVNGTGTTWLADVTIGDFFIKAGNALPIVYTVGGIVSDVQLTLTAPYGDATEADISYVIHRDFFPNGNPQMFSTDVETAGIFNETAKSEIVQGNLGTASFVDIMTGKADLTSGRVPVFPWAYVQDNILGAASQSAGIPTGAIIERGSNANGEFVKFADGTLICYGEITEGLTTTSTSGTWFFVLGATQTFPVPFVGEIPDVGNSGVTGSVLAIEDFGTTLTTHRPIVMSGIVSAAITGYKWSAIGRWF